VTSPNQGLFLPREGKGKEPGNEDAEIHGYMIYNGTTLNSACFNIYLNISIANIVLQDH
jgi:hypothetical protein